MNSGMKPLLSLLALVLLISNVPATAYATEEATAATEEIVEVETSAPAEATGSETETTEPETESTQPAEQILVLEQSAVSAEAVMAAKTELEATIEQQVRAFADSIDKSGADSDAALEIAQHGMFGSGKKLSVGKSHSLTATIWNSELFQYALVDSCAEAVRTMQKTDLTTLPNAHGTIGWYENNASYYLYTKLTPEGKEEDWDWELSYNNNYDGAFNGYDSSLCWIAGSTQWRVEMERTKATKSEVTYRVTCSVYDDFDFNSEGHTPIKELLGSIGALLFKAFRWESTASFNLKVPNSCTHSFGIYHWNYDPNSNSLVSDQSEGFHVNAASLRSYKDNIGETKYYYALENPIRLHHAKPWVVEYDVQYPSLVFLETFEKPNSATKPGLNQINNDLFFATKRNYYGLQLSGLFQPVYNESYTYRLENRIASNGSNMVYLTVIETKTNTVLVDTVPMDDSYIQDTNTGKLVIQDDRCDWLSGKDFYINFIGNYGHYFCLDYLDLRIWENGIDGGNGDYFTSKVTKPTCAAKGYTTHTCSLCGYSYKDTYTAQVPHTYGQWTVAKDATCTEQGEECRDCANCDYYETREIAAKGHNYVDGKCAACDENDPDYVPERLLGDVTGDDKVTATDYSRLLAHVMKVNLITDEAALAAADVTGDGKITATDYSRLLAHVKKVAPLW